jgi:PAS domain S-box-containing protein
MDLGELLPRADVPDNAKHVTPDALPHPGSPSESALTDDARGCQATELHPHYAEIVAGMSVGVYLVRLRDGQIIYANRKLEAMFGYGPGELVGLHTSDVDAPGERASEEAARDVMVALRQTGEWHGEVHNIRKDGATFRCYANVSILNHPEHGEVLVSVHTDVTHRKRAEGAAQEGENRYRGVFAAASDALFLFERDTGLVIDVSAAAEPMYGYTYPELVGRTLAEFSAEPETTASLLAAGGTHLALGHHTRKDGSTFPVEVTLSYYEQAGRRMGVGSVRDITDRKAAEAERERLIHELEDALGQVKTLSGLLPICAYCKKIRDEHGEWHQMEAYVMRRVDVEFSHGACPDCFAKLMAELDSEG